MMESRVLLTNADVVYSTFREIDPAFVTCFHYDNISDPDQATRVAKFCAPTDYAAQRFAKQMLASVHLQPGGTNLRNSHSHMRRSQSKGLSESNDAKEMLVARLQQKLNHIEREQCRA